MITKTPHIFCLDAPLHFPPSENFHVTGWIAGTRKINKVYCKTCKSRNVITLQYVDREDVKKVHPEMPFIFGFTGVIPTECVCNEEIQIYYSDENETFVYNKSLMHSLDMKLKSTKLARIEPILRKNLEHSKNTYNYNFLTPKLRTAYNIVPTDAVSSNNYDPIANSLIEKYSHGLILDAGAGFRGNYLKNVINFEIVPYASTDVVGVGEELPFKDNSFDAVFTLAVLEHVRDPFRCAQEIRRVLKPGGELYAVVPFLQPYHGYPSHYYNMTHQGLANLFSGMKIVQQEIIASGLPIWTLTWFLKSYCEGLPEQIAEAFRKMQVGELIANPELLLDKDYVKYLTREKNFELASTTMLIAEK